jgi:antitoxin component YwqK of YwqJK toxin-antitoxin module
MIDLRNASMRVFILFLLSLIIVTTLHGQQINIYPSDSIYRQRVIYDSVDTTDLWKFKTNLSKGQYWVIKNTECGSDTLEYAEFLSKGVKHGAWIKWEGGLCVGIPKEKNETEVHWVFASDNYKFSETHYDSGFIVKSILYHGGTNQPHVVHFYPENAIRENEWTRELIYTQDSILRWETIVHEDGTATHTDFYPDGKIKAQGRFNKEGSYEGLWQYYYPNGQLLGQGKFESGAGGLRFYAGVRIPKNEWHYWDEQGKLIADVTFENGEIIRINKFQNNKEIPFPDMNEMMYKN